MRVAVTGLGCITSLGDNVKELWHGLTSGQSGISRVTRFDPSNYPTHIGGEIADFDPDDYLPRKLTRRLDRYTQFFLVAADQAIEHAGLHDHDPARAGIATGVALGGYETMMDGILTAKEHGLKRVSPFTISQVPTNAASGQAAIRYNLQGPSLSLTTACAASADAIGLAAETIKRGAADVMIVGGAEAPFCDVFFAGFNQARALSTRNDEPGRASRPFDKNRDGFVAAEGAAVLMLESFDHAVARGVPILAELVGWGSSTDAYHPLMPHPEGRGAIQAMTAALHDAQLKPEAIDYINAHGTSTPLNDPIETAAIKTVFEYPPPVSSTKSMTGHLLGGAGALEAVATILALQDQLLPPTINLDEPDADCDLDYVPNEARPVSLDYAMSNSFGFGGHNTALIFGQVDHA